MLGRTLGHYSIVSELGAGGIGVVYEAVDTKLGRSVAIKRIRDELASDESWRMRFEREARVLASLNHPNIATIHGLEEADSVRFLVMELVPGATLAERLAQGPLTVQDALRVFRQVAEALKAAHEKGIVHRDLKPSNIKLAPEGRVKVLDFGLAKTVGELSGAAFESGATMTRTTGAGAILGTVAYMSPEQARGQPVDRRADIWAFGATLYESLTGRAAFAGATLSDTLARVIEREPDWEALPKSTPRSVRVLLRRCLRKEVEERLCHIGDARIELEETLSGRDIELIGISILAPMGEPREFSPRLWLEYDDVRGTKEMASADIGWKEKRGRFRELERHESCQIGEGPFSGGSAPEVLEELWVEPSGRDGPRCDGRRRAR